MRSTRSLCGGISLSLASVLALSSVPGCAKLEELTGSKKDEEAKPDAAKDEAKADDGKQDEPVVADGADAEAAPVEPIPVEELATGLDLMLELVPEGGEFVIARDATVVAEYVEEATRFLDGPLATLKAGPFAAEGGRDLQQADAMLQTIKSKTDAVELALASSGIDLKEGAVIAKAKHGESYLVFKAADPNALVAVGKATGESDFADLKCKAIEGVPGYNVCADSQKEVDAYKPAAAAEATRQLLVEHLPGVDLDAANLLAHVNTGSKDEVYMAMSTIPGQVHMAMHLPGNKDMDEGVKAIQPGAANTLAQVQPGAGFIWGRVSPELLATSMKESAAGNPMAESVAKSMTGEFVLAGSVDPGGLIFQAGTSDTASFETMMTATFPLVKDQVPKTIPDLPGATFTFDQVPVEGGGKTAQSLHIGVTGLAEADVLKSYTGLHLDGWMFAANGVLTLAVGPDKASIGKLLDVSSGGPSPATLDTLPPQLAEGLGRNEVGVIVHMPMDFLHGAQLHSLARSALKDLPEVPPDQLVALAGLMAPFSSATMWLARPGDKTVVHVAVQAIGNRATDEGKAALDAAHTVADGGDPAAAFASLASAYAASPMAWAYKTRAGTDGPGYMIGSGVGAVLAVAAVAVPVMQGKSNKALADDLGIKPDAPEPELVPTTPPKKVVTTTKPATPKKDPKKDPPKLVPPKEDPKEDPKKDDPKEDPKKDDPIVEPTRPLPPKPTPDPEKPTLKPKRFGKGQR
jgi:hypothetical protein